MTTLATFAHARAGDKGDTSIIMVAPFEPSEYPRLVAELTEPVVATHFGVAEERVSVRLLEHLGAVTLVIRGRLEGGVTRSPTADPHGKTLSGHLLDLELPGA